MYPRERPMDNLSENLNSPLVSVPYSYPESAFCLKNANALGFCGSNCSTASKI